MDLYMYATDDVPKTPVSPRYPWYTQDEYVEGTGIVVQDNVVVYTDEQLKKMKNVPDKDNEIADWDRRHDLHGYFHRLFLDKGGEYECDDTHFCIPDRVVLTLDDLNDFEKVLKENRLPETHKYQIAPEIQTLDEFVKEWVNAHHKRRREIATRIETNAMFLDEDLDIVKTARQKLMEGLHVYVCSSW